MKYNSIIQVLLLSELCFEHTCSWIGEVKFSTCIVLYMLKVIVCFECFFGSFNFRIRAYVYIYIYIIYRLIKVNETILKCKRNHLLL